MCQVDGCPPLPKIDRSLLVPKSILDQRKREAAAKRGEEVVEGESSTDWCYSWDDEKLPSAFDSEWLKQFEGKDGTVPKPSSSQPSLAIPLSSFQSNQTTKTPRHAEADAHRHAGASGQVAPFPLRTRIPCTLCLTAALT